MQNAESVDFTRFLNKLSGIASVTLSFFLYLCAQGKFAIAISNNLMAISKNLMLAQMEITERDGHPVEHEVIFCKADGSIRKMRAMNHVKHKQGNHEKSEGSKFKFNLKEKGALLLHDVDLDKPRTVLVDSIMYFNGMEVIH